MQSYLLLGVSIIITVASQLLFKRGMLAVGNVDFSVKNALFLSKQVLINPFLLAGLFLYGVSFILWLFVLSKIKLSIVYPMTSLNFILVAIMSFFLYQEKLAWSQYGGILLIIAGIIFLAKA